MSRIRPGSIPDAYGLARALGWCPRIDLETGIPQTYEWCPNRPRHRRRVRGDDEEGQGSICSSQAFLASAILTPPAPSERRKASLMFIGGVGEVAPANAGRINTQYTSGCTLIRALSGAFPSGYNSNGTPTKRFSEEIVPCCRSGLATH